MRNRIALLLAIPATVFVGWALPGPAQDRQGSPEGSAAIGKNAEAFIEAFHKGDAKALAAFWTPEGEYTDQTGKVLKGREAIEEAFKGVFADNKDLKLRIDSDSLHFVTTDVAIEKGTTSVFPPGGAPPSRAHFTIVHVKKDGQWLLDSVRDTPFVPPANYEHLRGLEWAIGEWTGSTDTGEVERLSLDWTENQNFIVSSFTTTAKNVSVGDATVWIGWDPTAKNIRAWLFDSTGGFGDGSWSQEGNKWSLKMANVLQDGKKATATFIIAPVDVDTISLQSKDRSADGNALPDTKEVKLKRVK
jgi:uncharacterized protein (TIGR02246 family)